MSRSISTIDVKSAQGNYPVIVDQGAEKRLATAVRQSGAGSKVFAVFDANLHALHGASIERAIRQSGCPLTSIVIPSGEQTKSEKTVSITRLGIIIGLVVAVIIGFYARGGYIIARATAIFFGLCASTFLPTAIGGLFWKRMTKAGAIASMVVGFVVTAVWVLLIKLPEAEDLGLVEFITGGQEKRSLLASCPNWPVVDSLLIALPLSVMTAIVVSLLTKPPDKEHVDRCFARAGELPQVPKAG